MIHLGFLQENSATFPEIRRDVRILASVKVRTFIFILLLSDFITTRKGLRDLNNCKMEILK